MLTENTQPAILAMSVAVCRLVESRGVRASFAAGHSLGEYSAHVAAGTLSYADALRTVRRRGRYMQEAVPVGEGAMAAILGLDVEGVTRACAETEAEHPGRVVTLANLNAPGQIVIAGHADAVALAGERAKALGADAGDRPGRERAVPLPADEAGGGSARAGAAGAAGRRSANPRRRQRRCRAEARCAARRSRR